MRIEIGFIIASTGGILRGEARPGRVEGISIDSRTTRPGDLFFALQGESFDGHDYIRQAWQAGAVAAVVSRPVEIPAEEMLGGLIQVDDTVQALQNLAGRYRQLFTIPIVAITGSVGKTTTKDMLAECLAPKYVTLKTPGNYNNEIGLPLTLLSIEPRHQAAVVELAMRAPGEISALARIVQPTYGIITNVEPVHVETMGGLDNIARAKCELLEYINNDKFALINGDDELLLKTARNYGVPQYTFGYNGRCDIQILSTDNNSSGIEVQLRIINQKEIFYCPSPARYLAVNLAAAAGAAHLMGVSPEEIRMGLAQYQPSGNRLRIINLSAGGLVVDDTYNANPTAMESALEVCKDLSNGRRTVAVLGDMLELGDYEKDGHIRVGKRVAELNLDMLITIGARAAYIGQGALKYGLPAARIMQFAGREECLDWLKTMLGQQEVILFKASRGMQLDKLLHEWLE